jgi:exopolyphosphatase/guanosine-5'-triphosphate,3'-diphosphate pyrophosphatase
LPAADRLSDRRRFRVVDSFSRIIRLGEGISATGCHQRAAIERAIAALSICRDKIRSRKAQRLRLIATEACRAASNADSFATGSRPRPASGSR